jgi:hypothetical protein
MLPEALGGLGLRASFSDGYQVSERSEDTHSEIVVKNLSANTGDGRVVRVQELVGADAKQGDSFIQGKLFQLNSIYEPHRDPYFAVLTKDTVCPGKFKLTHRKSVKTAEGSIDVLALYANDRMTYGACTEEQAAFRAFVALVQCKGGKSLYVVESFVPVKLLSDVDARTIDTIRCQ